MKKNEAQEKLVKARILLLEVEIMALQKDMSPFSEDLENIRRKLYNWEKLLQ